MGLDGENTWQWMGDAVMVYIAEDTADKTWRACVGDNIAHKVSHANDDGNVNAW